MALLCLCFTGSAHHVDSPAITRPVVIVGTDNTPPYYYSTADGTVAGVAVDVLTRAASRLDFDVKFVHLSGTPDSFLESNQVALWPVLAITEARRSKFHVTEPWLFNTFCLLKRRGFKTPNPKETRIANWNNPMNVIYAARFFPAAQRSSYTSREEVMRAVCLGHADGGLIEIRVLDSLLLQRPKDCESVSLAKQSLPNAAFPMGIVATKRFSREANALHSEITHMANTGELAKIFETWSSISANEANSIVAMNSAQQKMRFAYGGVMLLLVAAGVVFVQFRRMRIAYRLARREFAERKRAEEARRAADRTRNTVLEGAGEGICGLDANGRTIFMNSTAMKLLGLSAAIDSYDFHALVHGHNLDVCSESCGGFQTSVAGEVLVETGRFLRHGGTPFPVEFVFSPVMEDNAYTGAVVTFRDISARQQADLLESDRNCVLEMLAQNEPLEAIFTAIAQLAEKQYPGFYCTIMTVCEDRIELGPAPSLPKSLRTVLQALNRGAASLSCGAAVVWSKPVIISDISTDLLWENHRQAAREAHVACSWSYPILSASGDVLGTVALYGGAPASPDYQQLALLQILCRLARLAIEQSRLTQKLHHQANHDSLTSFPNRLLFEQRLRHALAAASRTGDIVALFFIDLDRFKQINDTLSHRVGDLYLCQVANRLSSALPASATLARLGGDEFGVVIPIVQNPAEAESFARNLLQAMTLPFLIDGYTLFGTASVGICLSTENMSAAELQSCADQAMYRAKGIGRNRHQFYSAEMSRNAIAQVETENMIREALANDQFHLYYQPQCRANGDLIGFEALIRLQHPERGIVPPAEFISIAEDCGLIVPVGAWVLRETCRQIAVWQKEGAPPVPVAINVSAAQLSQGNFAQQVAATLAEYQLDPSVLEIELTESMIMGNFDESLAQMTELRDLGVRLSIDDFGTGYSSLSYLHRLPIQTIKVDQSFVRAMDADVSTRPLVEAIVAAARSLKCNVIAEGVETDMQRRELSRMGCDHMQGYFFGKPLPAEHAVTPFLLQLAS